MQLLDPAAARAVIPRQAATVLLLRDADDGPQVLMVRRSDTARFMPGAYVFPGGAVDPGDADAPCDESAEALAARLAVFDGLGPQAKAFAVAALRESLEECGLLIGADPAACDLPALRDELFGGRGIGACAQARALVLATSLVQPWARWITPFGRPRRFDTVFFVCRAPDGQVPEVDARETTTLCWVSPAAALREQSEGRFQMEFATRAIVRSLLPFAGASVQACLDHAAGLRGIATVSPRLRLDADGNVTGVLMPDDEGYPAGYA